MLSSVNSATPYTLTLLKEILTMLITRTMVPYVMIDVINLIVMLTHMEASGCTASKCTIFICQLCFNKAER